MHIVNMFDSTLPCFLTASNSGVTQVGLHARLWAAIPRIPSTFLRSKSGVSLVIAPKQASTSVAEPATFKQADEVGEPEKSAGWHAVWSPSLRVWSSKRFYRAQTLTPVDFVAHQHAARATAIRVGQREMAVVARACSILRAVAVIIVAQNLPRCPT